MSDKHTIKTDWKGGLAFETNVNGHKIVMDAPVEAGGQNSGPGPKKLQLIALSGCTGMDIVTILKKMRVEFSNLEVEVQGDDQGRNQPCQKGCDGVVDQIAHDRKAAGKLYHRNNRKRQAKT